MREVGGGRVAVYGVENASRTPIYVHAKVCIVDDTWVPRAPLDPAGRGDGARTYARDLRLQLTREHLDRGDDDGLIDPLGAFDELRRSAAALQAWHDAGRVGARPAGRLRPLVDPELSTTTTRWATLAYHHVYDPDGRPRSQRRRQEF